MSETVTMTLTDFLLARIAEDEEQASWHHRLLCMRTACDNEGCVWQEGEQDAMERERVCTCGYPERVLAECEAKRRIVEWAAPILTNWPGAPEGFRYVSDDGRDLLMILAAVYAEHPDCDEAWRA